MTIRSNKPSGDSVTAFLSCSVRPEDRALVDAIEARVLWPMGFRCLTVGRNISLPDQVDDAVRDLMNLVDCLIGIATVRLDAAERSLPNRTLALASPYILQESATAHQRQLPWLIFKTPPVTLQGVTARNPYIEVEPELRNGRPAIRTGREALTAALSDLKRRAVEFRGQKTRNDILSGLGRLSTGILGAYAIGSLATWLSRPNCFGAFYYQDPECRGCSYKPDCKIEKLQRQSSLRPR